MSTTSSSGNRSSNISKAYTRVNKLSSDFTWTISNYSLLKKQPGESLKSPSFKVDDGRIEYYLKLYPAGFLDHSEFAGVALSQATEVEHVCQFTISVLIERRPVVIIRAGSCDFARSSNSYRLRELFKLKNSHEVLSEDTLTLRCDLTIVGDSESLLIEQPIADAAATRPKWKFNELFLSERLSDVRLRTACGRTIPAHKVLLAAASPIFDKMFSHDMLESQENFVCINDIGYEALVQMLRYVYAAGIRDGVETSLMCELLEAADKYDIEGLRLECERILCENLTVENAIDLFSTALKHNADSLKVRARKFIGFHRKKIIESNRFTQKLDRLTIIDVMEALSFTECID
ncbi:hypothetical protein TKK_0019117 [Trichogramma kaykai]|uniref:BTB domain-containing protein n=1 Tax=Trichogramma kaykai TaxID=54128 RepID=A0ABD2VUF2_9HYME